jgi:DNA-3-methyladenine glycosylase
MDIISKPFYDRDALLVSQDLLGKYLIRCYNVTKLAGKIVEVEAYKGKEDPASHAFRGCTSRNEALFMGPGLSYVYFVYGNHFCFNITTNNLGCVLVRAIEPVEGVSEMMENRGVKNVINIANGPGKLTKAMNITMEQYGIDLTEEGELYIIVHETDEKSSIVTSKRVGVKKASEKLWRFYIKDNPFVSKT